RQNRNPRRREGDGGCFECNRGIEVLRRRFEQGTENYASSTWCLDELVEIRQSSGNGEKKTILPVFYGMLPEDVTSCFEGDFDRHKKEYTYERVDGWLQAVSWIIGISGWVFMNDWYVVRFRVALI
ncbi:Toll/interleukin-1 receptor-like protein, partial [Linum perenne]